MGQFHKFRNTGMFRNHNYDKHCYEQNQKYLSAMTNAVGHVEKNTNLNSQTFNTFGHFGNQ